MKKFIVLKHKIRIVEAEVEQKISHPHKTFQVYRGNPPKTLELLENQFTFPGDTCFDDLASAKLHLLTGALQTVRKATADVLKAESNLREAKRYQDLVTFYLEDELPEQGAVVLDNSSWPVPGWCYSQ